MSKFYLGCRVVKARNRTTEHAAEHGRYICVPIGATGVLTDIDFGRKSPAGVLWDGESVTAYGHFYQLEPLDDDSRQLTTWDQCAWQPRVVAGERA